MKRSKGYRVVAPDRYLRVLDEPVSVVVSLDGERIARSTRARRLVEGDRPPVIYVPREDVDTARLVPSERTYRCRWKGDAAYFHVDVRDRTLENVVWSYPDAPDALAALRDLIAFDAAVFELAVDEPAGDARRDGGAAFERHSA